LLENAKKRESYESINKSLYMKLRDKKGVEKNPKDGADLKKMRPKEKKISLGEEIGSALG
jgi:ssDNA-binding Zn-finger/Zn-ribbon topoisomerase 1